MWLWVQKKAAIYRMGLFDHRIVDVWLWIFSCDCDCVSLKFKFCKKQEKVEQCMQIIHTHSNHWIVGNVKSRFSTHCRQGYPDTVLNLFQTDGKPKAEMCKGSVNYWLILLLKLPLLVAQIQLNYSRTARERIFWEIGQYDTILSTSLNQYPFPDWPSFMVAL